jgi:hypothetical protein
LSWKKRRKTIMWNNLRNALEKGEQNLKAANQNSKLQKGRKNRGTDLKSEIATDFAKFDIPYYEWSLRFRPMIEGKKNMLRYLVMWHDIYRDEHPWIMLSIARQLGKTTWGGGKLAYYGCKIHTKAVYVTFSDESQRSFSNDKYRGSVLHTDNPELFEIVKGAGSGKGALSRVEFLTDSSTSLVTDANEMHHVEGKSADFLFFDEAQNLNLDAYVKAKESQAWTQGKTIIAGIGGYLGTMHHKFWLSTNQMRWIFHTENWRDKLQFDSGGLVWDDYLIDLLAGHWEPQAPKNSQRHGYWLSQEMFPNIPLTRHDAVEKYHTAEDASIQWKREHYAASYYTRHVLGQFVKGHTRLFTKEMLHKLFDRNLSFTRPEDVDRSKGKIYAAADWGGGTTAFTVLMISQCLHPTGPIFKILYIKRVDDPDVEKQADMFINLCDAYEVDHIGMDAGGGPRQAQKVEKTYADRCTKITYLTRPDTPLPRENETDRLRQENRFTIDRTYSFDRLKDLIENPFVQEPYAFPRFIVPGADPQKISWIVDDFEAVQGELIKLKGTGQDYIRYTHDASQPDDAVHSFNYTWIAQMIDKGSDVWLKSF